MWFMFFVSESLLQSKTRLEVDRIHGRDMYDFLRFRIAPDFTIAPDDTESSEIWDTDFLPL